MATYTYPSSLIENAPRTNVGIVNIGDNQFVAPRDPRAKDILNYSSSGTTFYDRPEELEFAPDPNEPGIYNTELNPFNPSSQFFPYEPDYGGIMSARAYEDAGEPMGSDARLQKEYEGYGKVYDQEGFLVENPEEGQLMYDAKGRPIMEDNYGLYWQNKINVSPSMHTIGPPQLGYQDPEEQRDTVFHEGKHFFIDQYGNLVPKASEADERDAAHNALYFADMWRKDPFTYNTANMTLNRQDALAFMEMQNLGRNVTQGNYTLPESKTQTSNRRWQELVNDPGFEGVGDDVIHDPIMEQRFNQYGAMYAPGRGDYTRPTMTQGEMARDARMTGGGVNPHEATRAGYTGRLDRTVSSPTPSPSRGRANPHFNAGGIAGLPGQWTPSMSESEEEEYDIRPLQLDPGIMSIEDLEDLFEEVGLDKRLIYNLINTGGLSQFVV
jgi:hypothetical protein